MAQFKLEDYETVAERLPKFLGKYKAGRVNTQLMSPISDISVVVFKAELFDGETLLSTGWAFEREGAGYVNKTSHLENCETSAIGRALANIGIHGDKRPSREEMEKVERAKQTKQQAQSKQKPPEDEQPPEAGPLLSQHEQAEIKKKLKDAGVPPKAFGIWLKRVVNVSKLHEVPQRWYQHIHTVLDNRPDEMKAMGGDNG